MSCSLSTRLRVNVASTLRYKRCCTATVKLRHRTLNEHTNTTLHNRTLSTIPTSTTHNNNVQTINTPELTKLQRSELLKWQKQLIVQSDRVTIDQLQLLWSKYNTFVLNEIVHADVSKIILPNINATTERLKFAYSIITQILTENIHSIHYYTINLLLMKLERNNMIHECIQLFELYTNTAPTTRKTQPNSYTLSIIMTLYQRHNIQYTVESMLRVMYKYNMFNDTHITLYNQLLQHCIHTKEYVLGCSIYEKFIIERINTQHSTIDTELNETEQMLIAYNKQLQADNIHDLDAYSIEKPDLSAYQHINTKHTFMLDRYTVDAVATLYVRTKQYSKVLQLYDNIVKVQAMRQNDDMEHDTTNHTLLTIKAYQQIVTACIQLNNTERIAKILRHMSQNSVKPDVKFFDHIVSAFLKQDNLVGANQVLTLMQQYNISMDTRMYVQYIYYYNKQHQYKHVCRMYEQMIRSDTFDSNNINSALYNTVMYAYTQIQQYDTAKSLLQQLVLEQQPVDSVTFSILIEQYAKAGKVAECAHITGFKRKYANDNNKLNLLPDADNYYMLIQCCNTTEQYQYVYSAYNAYCNDVNAYNAVKSQYTDTTEQPKYNQLALYHAVIQTCTVLKDYQKSFNVLYDITEHGYITPIDYTYNEVLKCCIACKQWHAVKDLVKLMNTNNCGPNQWTLNLLTNASYRVKSDKPYEQQLYKQCVQFVESYMNDSKPQTATSAKAQQRIPTTFKVSLT